MKRLLRVEVIFAFLVLFPLLLFLVGSLRDSDTLRRWAGVSSVPLILFCLGAFFANWSLSRKTPESIAKRRQRIQSLLQELEDSDRFELVVRGQDKSEKVIRFCDGALRVFQDGIETIAEKDDLLEQLDAQGKDFSVRSRKNYAREGKEGATPS